MILREVTFSCSRCLFNYKLKCNQHIGIMQELNRIAASSVQFIFTHLTCQEFLLILTLCLGLLVLNYAFILNGTYYLFFY